MTVMVQGMVLPPTAKLCRHPGRTYATKDGKITVSYQGWDQSKVVLDG
jgi:hypothetical protein